MAGSTGAGPEWGPTGHGRFGKSLFRSLVTPVSPGQDGADSGNAAVADLRSQPGNRSSTPRRGPVPTSFRCGSRSATGPVLL